jgi:hypothetical protein
MRSTVHRTTIVTVALSLMVLRAAASDQVPFRASIDTEPMMVGSCGPGCLQLEISGTGHATHLGSTEIAGPSQVDVVLGQQTGTSTLTAANGDTMVIAVAGTVDFHGPNPTDPVSFQGEWQVIGGTGRFENAAGGGTYSGTSAGSVGNLLLSGSVNSPGGSD